MPRAIKLIIGGLVAILFGCVLWDLQTLPTVGRALIIMGTITIVLMMITFPNGTD